MVFLDILLVVISVIFLIAFGVLLEQHQVRIYYVSSILTYTIVLQRLLYVM